MKSYWLLLLLIVSSGAALLWPTERFGVDPFRTSPALLWSLIVVTMFSLGTLVRSEELQPLRRHPWWVVLGVFAQVLAMPAAAWIVVQVVPMSPELASGVILVGCVPGAMASNVLTHTAGGSVAYSVSLTAVATILSPITVPSVLWVVTSQTADKPLWWISLRLFLCVVVPTIAGYFLAKRTQRLRSLSDKLSPAIASVALLWIIAGVVAGNRDRLFEVALVMLLALLMINLIGYLAGNLVARGAGLPERYQRALTLEVGMQNAGLGTALAVSLHGPDTVATIPTAAYTFGCMLTGTMLAVYWSRNSAPST